MLSYVNYIYPRNWCMHIIGIEHNVVIGRHKENGTVQRWRRQVFAQFFAAKLKLVEEMAFIKQTSNLDKVPHRKTH